VPKANSRLTILNVGGNRAECRWRTVVCETTIIPLHSIDVIICNYAFLALQALNDKCHGSQVKKISFHAGLDHKDKFPIGSI